MRFSAVIGLTAVVLSASPGLAAEPIGEWLVQNKKAQIKIDNCGGALWGVVSWEATPGGRDSENPDPALRSRPTLGMPILINMKEATNRTWSGNVEQVWKGEVYNAENGKTYDSNIKLVNPNTLKIEGCVLGVLCGGQEWTRVPASAAPPVSQPRGARGKAAPAASSDVCSKIASLQGRN
jgi:uncharacterized protein (DUF2147 family)